MRGPSFCARLALSRLPASEGSHRVVTLKKGVNGSRKGVVTGVTCTGSLCEGINFAEILDLSVDVHRALDWTHSA